MGFPIKVVGKVKGINALQKQPGYYGVNIESNLRTALQMHKQEHEKPLFVHIHGDVLKGKNIGLESEVSIEAELLPYDWEYVPKGSMDGQVQYIEKFRVVASKLAVAA